MEIFPKSFRRELRKITDTRIREVRRVECRVDATYPIPFKTMRHWVACSTAGARTKRAQAGRDADKKLRDVVATEWIKILDDRKLSVEGPNAPQFIGGTVSDGQASLCNTCRSATIIRGPRLSDEIIACGKRIISDRITFPSHTAPGIQNGKPFRLRA